MKFILPLAVGASFAEARLIQRENVSKPSRSSVNTVYTFVGSGSGSNVLQMPSSSSSPTETSDSGRESSALSQLLHASTASADRGDQFTSASVTASPTSLSGADASSNSSSNYTGPDAGGKSPSSTKSAASSGAANRIGAPIMAGGVAVAAIAML